ncbi:MAG: alkaline phosphatase family protein, partial [Flavobacteriales bacterium]
FIDQWIGMNNCMIFLTADHGGARNPSYLSDQKMPAGYIDFNKIKDSLNAELKSIFGSDKLILSMNNDQVYFNQTDVFEKSINYENLLSYCERFILNHQGVQDVYRKENIRFLCLSDGNIGKIQRGYMPKRSGDLLILLEPSWMDYPPTGTTHGSNHSYDTHVPLLFMGWKIPKGKSSTKVHVEDIAPSISQWLNIAFPNACSGKPLELKLMD